MRSRTHLAHSRAHTGQRPANAPLHALPTPLTHTQGATCRPYESREVSLSATPHAARGDLWLSPEFRLLADTPGVREFEYDGCGHRLVLPPGVPGPEATPLLVVSVLGEGESHGRSGGGWSCKEQRREGAHARGGVGRNGSWEGQEQERGLNEGAKGGSGSGSTEGGQGQEIGLNEGAREG
eukprot:225575-Chlamydomonas_euryale.AAC.1